MIGNMGSGLGGLHLIGCFSQRSFLSVKIGQSWEGLTLLS